jgi:hypothetical protein
MTIAPGIPKLENDDLDWIFAPPRRQRQPGAPGLGRRVTGIEFVEPNY